MTCRLALLAAFLLLAGSAQAQINPFRGKTAAPRLADSDLPLLDQAGRKLLGDKAPNPDTSEVWQNDATGAGGTVTYIGPSHRKVGDATYACRRLKYSVTQKGRPTPRTARLSGATCRTGAGRSISRTRGRCPIGDKTSRKQGQGAALDPQGAERLLDPIP